MKRRTFLLATTCAAAPPTTLEFSNLPNFCSHEHWGSIDSIGTVPEGFRVSTMRQAAAGVLHNNAVTVYGIGRQVDLHKG
jgi:hypothetical protein